MDTPSQISKQQLVSLGRKPLLVARKTGSSTSFTFLERIERIEVNETRVHDGVTYYVLDVFLYHVNSRLPTNVANHQLLARSTSPDFQIERRFSEFVKLRSQVSDATLLKLDCVCAYCAEFSMYLSFSMHQPRALTKLMVVSTEKRKKMLVSFINDFVRLSKSKELQNDSCETHEPVPHLIGEFMREDVEIAAPPVSQSSHFMLGAFKKSRHKAPRTRRVDSSIKPRSLRVMMTHLAHKAALGGHAKFAIHFARCFTEALKEFAASDTNTTDEEKDQYDPKTWGLHDFSSGAYIGYWKSLLLGYTELSLVLMDPDVFIPVTQFGRPQRSWIMDVLCDDCNGGHSEWLAEHTQQVFNDHQEIKPLAVEEMQIIRNHCAMLFRCMHRARGENKFLDPEFVAYYLSSQIFHP